MENGKGKMGERRKSLLNSQLFLLLSPRDTKYKSNTPGLEGWPSFYDVLKQGKVELQDDFSFGMHRTEVICANCGAHLGHVFDDEYDPQLKDKGGKHYCINSCALNFNPQEK